MSLYRNVTSKPWLEGGVAGEEHARPALDMPDQKVALTLFLGSATVIFSLLAVSYYIRMGYGDWVPLSVPGLVWINTACLLASSVFFQWATRAARAGHATGDPTIGVSTPYVIGGLLAIAFIGGQYIVWQQLGAAGYHAAANPANGFFYLLTMVHVLHLLGGLWVWSKGLLQLQPGKAQNGELKLKIELCTWYWHFLLVVWLGLLYLMATT